MAAPVRARDRQAVLNALRTGVVPARGLEHIQVGRAAEVEALTRDIRHVKDGGSAVRFITGEYGSGKSFFLTVMRQAAQRAGCVTMNADVSQTSRLYGTGGKVRTLISTLVASTSTRSQPEGGALVEVLERFCEVVRERAAKEGRDMVSVARRSLEDVRGLQGGFAFADVVVGYALSSRDGDEARREASLRWLRAEYTLKSEARAALGVTAILGDADLYPLLRLFALLCRKAGYGGLVVNLDELGVLSAVVKSARQQNFETILTMVNDLLQGRSEGLAVFFASVPDFVSDNVRGLYSYGALRSRLAPNEFIGRDMQDTAGPVISLRPFEADDLLVLLENVHRVYCSNGQRDPLPDEEPMAKFLEHAAAQLGGLEHVSPREGTKSWLHFLDALDQNRRKDWRELLPDVAVSVDLQGAAPSQPDREEFLVSVATSFRPGSANDLADFRL